MRILARKAAQGVNCLEVTGIKIKHFVAIPYTIVSAHWRHLQADFRLAVYSDGEPKHEKRNGPEAEGSGNERSPEWKEQWEI